jgi:hypothetical protein
VTEQGGSDPLLLTVLDPGGKEGQRAEDPRSEGLQVSDDDSVRACHLGVGTRPADVTMISLRVPITGFGV